MKPRLVGIEAARATLKDLCAAAARGEEVVITRRGRPIARVVGMEANRAEDPEEVRRRVRAGIPAAVLEAGGACACPECGGILVVRVSAQGRAIQCSPSCAWWIE